MNCQSCNATITENDAFCPQCGTAVIKAPAQAETVEEVAPVAKEEKAESTATPAVDEVKRNALSLKILILSIVGLATAFIFGLPGLIISGIAKKKIKAYDQTYKEADARIKTCKHLAPAGFVLGLIITVVALASFLIHVATLLYPLYNELIFDLIAELY